MLVCVAVATHWKHIGWIAIKVHTFTMHWLKSVSTKADVFIVRKEAVKLFSWCVVVLPNYCISEYVWPRLITGKDWDTSFPWRSPARLSGALERVKLGYCWTPQVCIAQHFHNNIRFLLNHDKLINFHHLQEMLTTIIMSNPDHNWCQLYFHRTGTAQEK